MSDLDQAAGQLWVERWDAQQEQYMVDREERFTVLIDAVEAGAGRLDPLVIDLGCGPGSLGVRLLARLPAATVVGVDRDPILLALGGAAYRDVTGLRFVDQDLRAADWVAALGLDRPADAAVSTTALHWLPGHALHAVYAALATVLRPGGLLLNGDHLADDPAATPVLASLGDAVRTLAERRRGPAGTGEDWKAWWAAVTEDPALAGPAAQRAWRRLSEDHHGSETLLLGQHLTALRDAGFSEVGTLWQHGDNRVLAAVR
ncbi:MAG TPA: class I SAM-dependent methyltransferase [Streptosporangiaceae bacterium]|nr:class I SAM-dependent methyltransferase [Streptosporangiaceae bacterium]